jgi:hypothetical protein
MPEVKLTKEKMVKDKEYVEDNGLLDLANNVINKERLTHLIGVSIKFLFVVPEISRTVHARVIRGTAELRHFGQFDYLVEFSHKIWQSINDETRYLLMYHELLHPIVSQDKKGNTNYKMINHDIQDFSQVINKAGGVHWFNEFKDIVSSTYEMTGPEKDQIKI